MLRNRKRTAVTSDQSISFTIRDQQRKHLVEHGRYLNRQQEHRKGHQGRNDNSRETLSTFERRMKSAHRRSGMSMARAVFFYCMVATVYTVCLLSSDAFLQTNVANAFAFKLPKPPRIASDIINRGRSNDDGKPIAPILQDWSFNKQLTQDGTIKYSLKGTVRGHPAIPDGDVMTTAPLEGKALEIATNMLFAETKGNAKKNPTYIIKQRSSKYSKLVTTIAGTKYALLPPNIRIGDAPLLSQVKGGVVGSTDGQLSKSLPYKDQVVYLEEQIDVVRLLAEQEDEQLKELEEKQATAEITRNAGIIVTAALTGAAFFAGDDTNMVTTTTDPTVIQNTIVDPIVKPSASSTKIDNIEEIEESVEKAGEIQFAQPAKAVLPYLEERIRALEEALQEQQQQQQQNENEINKDKQQRNQDEVENDDYLKIAGGISDNVEHEEKSPVIEPTKFENERPRIETTKKVQEGNKAVSSSTKSISTAESTVTSMTTPEGESPKENSKQTHGSKNGLSSFQSSGDNKSNNKVIEEDAAPATITTNYEAEESTIIIPDEKKKIDERELGSSSKASMQMGITKMLTDVKESNQQTQGGSNIEDDSTLIWGSSTTTKDETKTSKPQDQEVEESVHVANGDNTIRMEENSAPSSDITSKIILDKDSSEESVSKSGDFGHEGDSEIAKFDTLILEKVKEEGEKNVDPNNSLDASNKERMAKELKNNNESTQKTNAESSDAGTNIDVGMTDIHVPVSENDPKSTQKQGKQQETTIDIKLEEMNQEKRLARNGIDIERSLESRTEDSPERDKIQLKRSVEGADEEFGEVIENEMKESFDEDLSENTEVVTRGERKVLTKQQTGDTTENDMLEDNKEEKVKNSGVQNEDMKEKTDPTETIQEGMKKIFADFKELTQQQTGDITETDILNNDKEDKMGNNGMQSEDMKEEIDSQQTMQEETRKKGLADLKEVTKQQTGDTTENDMLEDNKEEKVKNSGVQNEDVKGKTDPTETIQEGMKKIFADFKELTQQQTGDITETDILNNDKEDKMGNNGMQSEDMKEEIDSQQTMQEETRKKGLADLKEVTKQQTGDTTENDMLEDNKEEKVKNSGVQNEDVKGKTDPTETIQEGMKKIFADFKELTQQQTGDITETDILNNDKEDKMGNNGMQSEDMKEEIDSQQTMQEETRKKGLADLKEVTKQEIEYDKGSELIEDNKEEGKKLFQEETKEDLAQNEDTNIEIEASTSEEIEQEEIKNGPMFRNESTEASMDITPEERKDSLQGDMEGPVANSAIELESQDGENLKSDHIFSPVKEINKLATEMSQIRQNGSNEFEKKLLDLALAGTQVIKGEVDKSDVDIDLSDDIVSKLTSTALSIFGEDGVVMLNQISMDEMKKLSDTLSLNQLWAQLVEFCSKAKLLEDPSISELLKEYSDDDVQKIELVSAASFVAIVGGTIAISVRSKLTSEADGYYSDDYGNYWDDESQYSSSWESIESDFEGQNDYNPNTDSPFPFATSNWGDSSTTDPESWEVESHDYETEYYPSTPEKNPSAANDHQYTDVEKAQSQEMYRDQAFDQKGLDIPKLQGNDVYEKKTDSPESPSNTQRNEEGGATGTTTSRFSASSKLGDRSTNGASPFPNESSTFQKTEQGNNFPKKSTSPFGSGPKAGPSPFGSGSYTFQKNEEGNNLAKNGTSPFGNGTNSSTPPFGGAASSLPKSGQQGERFKKSTSPFDSGPKGSTPPFGGAASSLPKSGQQSEGFKESTSPFGSGPATAKTGQGNTFPKKNTSPFGSGPKGNTPFGGAASTLPKSGQQGEGFKKSTSPFGSGPATAKTGQGNTFPKKNTSPFGSVPKGSTPPFGGASSSLPKSGQQGEGFKKSTSPFGSGPATAKTGQGNTFPKKSTSPFGSGPATAKTGQGNTFPKKSTSPFGSGLKSSTPPFGGASSSLPKSGQQGEGFKKSTSPFDSGPKGSTPPFGGAASSLPKSGQQGEGFKKSTSPFGSGPATAKTGQGNTFPKKSTSPFGSAPKGSTPPFGGASSTLPKPGQQSEGFKKSTSPFGSGPATAKTGQGNTFPKKSTSPFGSGPKGNTPFGGAASSLPKSGQQSEGFKKSTSPFDSGPKGSTPPFGGAASSLPKSGQQGEGFKKSTSPFGSGPATAKTGQGNTFPKKRTSPFGGGTTALPNYRQGNSFPNKAASPFGVAKSTFPKTGPKNEATRFSGGSSVSPKTEKQSESPKIEFSPFGGQSSASPVVGQETDGRPQRGDLSNWNPTDKANMNNVNDETRSSPVDETDSSDFRIKPKLPSKPQNDMYERMQMEQAKRLEEYERKQRISNGDTSMEVKKPVAKEAQETPYNVREEDERRKLAEERADIEEKRRIIAQEMAQLEKQKQETALKSLYKKGSQGEEKRSGYDVGANEEKNSQMTEEDKKEKERMKEIQRLAREQARFEIDARGLSKEEKSVLEKPRMERLQQLAREQARFEYDRRHANTRKELTNQSETKKKSVGESSVFKTSGTRSDDRTQDRIRQEFSMPSKKNGVRPRANNDSQKQVREFQVADMRSNEEKMQEQVRQYRQSSTEEETLMGTKKINQNKGSMFKSVQTASTEDVRREKSRLDQLENLAEKKGQYKTRNNIREPPNDVKKRSFYEEESGTQIIDVVAKDDTKDVDDSKITDSGNYDKEGQRNQEQVQDENYGDRKAGSRAESPHNRLDRESKNREKQSSEKYEKRKQLEAQARQRSKQQSIRNERLKVDQKVNSSSQRIIPEASNRVVVVEDRVRKDPEQQTYLQPESRLKEQKGLAKRQKEVADAIMKTDGSYKPSTESFANTSRMLKEVCGFPLSDYKGSKQFVHKKTNMGVYVGRTLSVPVRVSTPGTFVEFSINKKASEFDFGVKVVPDKGYAIDIKKSAPFTKHSGKGKTLLQDTVLVGAACAPCTLQFKFENKQSTLLEKVIISYDIKVTSPSRELLLGARRLRAESCLQAVEEDLLAMTGGTKSTTLKEEINSLQSQIDEKTKKIDSLKDEERRWVALIAKMEASKV